MIRSVHEVATYTKIHSQHNVLISTKLWHPATLWLWRCLLNQLIVHSGFLLIPVTPPMQHPCIHLPLML